MAAGMYHRAQQGHNLLPLSSWNGQGWGAECVGFNAAGIANPFPAIISPIVLIMYNSNW